MSEENKASYDRLAVEYTRRIYDELNHKPFDRELLDRFAALVGPGKVYDMGCGPGHVARYLAERGLDVSGLDLSPQMIEQARALNPGLSFVVSDMAKIDLPGNNLAAIVAFYSLIHIPRPQLGGVLREFQRVLAPGGWLLVAFHKGSEIRHFDALWDIPVNLDFIFFEKAEMEGFLREAGFEIVESHERPPYPTVEAATERVYLLARKI